MIRAILIVLSGLFVAGTAMAGTDTEQGRGLFAQTCAKCHDDTVTQERLQGPPLFGVVGRRIGAVKGFGYSNSLKKANGQGRTWTEAELDAYLADPEQSMPGGYMPLAVPDKAARGNLIAYLRTLTAAKP